jgi:ectoine hydroxylase-related dioxygenase (phytanoyl-CoA dioxygenase family)
MNRLFENYPDWAAIEPVPVEMPAGGCSFHNALLAHAAGPNMTTGRRRAMVAIYMPDGVTFNGQQNTYPPEVFERLKVGDVLNDETQNPRVYARDGMVIN